MKLFNFSDNKYVAITIRIFIICFALIILFSLNTSNGLNFLKLASLSILLCIASFVFGGALGFLFAIPNHKDSDVKERFERNTSLRQISDWLTKIIVGVTLVELKSIFSFLKKLISVISNFINVDLSVNVLVGLIIVIFSITGFVILHILTVTIIFRDLVNSDNEILNLLSNINAQTGIMNITDILPADEKKISEEEKSQIVSYVSKHGIKVDDAYLARKLGKVLVLIGEYSYAANSYAKAYEINQVDDFKINEAYIRSKYLKDNNKSNEILIKLIESNTSSVIAYYNLACNYNRELRDLDTLDELYSKELIDKIELNLKAGFQIDKHYYGYALKDPELKNLKENGTLKRIFDSVK